MSDQPASSDRARRYELPERVRLVVLFGGQSAEHEVSRTTAANVLEALDGHRYAVELVGIDRGGRWHRVGSSALPGPEAAALVDASPVGDSPAIVTGELAATVDEDASSTTVVLPLLHGPNGEDGTMQGLLELSGLPYVGSGVLGSAMSMDKVAAKQLCAHHGIPQGRWVGLHERDVDSAALTAAAEDLGFPIFVKPANLGSSIGISKATDRAELADAVAEALRHDETIVLEEMIVGREIEIGVLGNETIRVSVPGEIVPGAEFYDYEDKYRTGAAQLVIPADLPDEVTKTAAALAMRTFRALRGADLARVDFLYEADERGLLLNEMNTLPGFTPMSMYPQLWAASGVPYPELLDELVRLAIERHAHRGNRRR